MQNMESKLWGRHLRLQILRPDGYQVTGERTTSRIIELALMRTDFETPLLVSDLLGALSYCEIANALIELQWPLVVRFSSLMRE